MNIKSQFGDIPICSSSRYICSNYPKCIKIWSFVIDKKDNLQFFTVDWSWNTWGEWGTCTGACDSGDGPGAGQVARQRNCNAALHGGTDCTAETDIDTMACSNTNTCSGMYFVPTKYKR